MFSGTPSVSGGGWSRASRKSSRDASPPPRSAYSSRSGGNNNQVARLSPSTRGTSCSSRSAANSSYYGGSSVGRGSVDSLTPEKAAQQERVKASLREQGFTECSSFKDLMKKAGRIDSLVYVRAETSTPYDRNGNPVQVNELDAASRNTPAREFTEIVGKVAQAASSGNKAPKPRRQSTSTASGWGYPSSSAGSRSTSLGGPPRLRSIQEYPDYTPGAPNSRSVQSRQSGQSRQRAPSVRSGQSAPSEQSTRSVQSGITNRTLRPKDSNSVASYQPRPHQPLRSAPNVPGSSREYVPTAEQIYRHNKKSNGGRR